MNKEEFIGAANDPDSEIAKLTPQQYAGWLKFFDALDGVPIRPLVCQDRAHFESYLESTRLAAETQTMIGAALGPKESELIAKYADEVVRLALQPSGSVSPAPVSNTSESRTGQIAIDVIGSWLKESVVASHAEKSVAEPSSDEDRAALQSIEAEFAKIRAMAEGTLSLPRPPAALVKGLITEIGSDIKNFEQQQGMVAGRNDMSSFSARLDQILSYLRGELNRCQEALSHPPSDLPHLPPSAPASHTAQTPQPDTAADFRRKLAESMAKHAEEMKKRREEFEKWQKQHNDRQKEFDAQNDAWSKRFNER